MAKKQREKVSFIEEILFEDFEHAQRAVKRAKFNQIRILIGLVIAAVSTGFTIYGLLGSPVKTTWADYAIFLAIPAYIIGGGIGKVLKTAWNITKIGWFLLPFFPADLLIAAWFFLMSIFAFLFVPVVFVVLNYIQHKKTLDAAKSYLAHCGYVLSAETEI